MAATTLSATSVAVAAATPVQNDTANCAEVPDANASQNEDIALACKIAQLDNDRFSTTNNGKKLESDLTDAELKSDYSFNDEQVSDFRDILAGKYTPTTTIESSTGVQGMATTANAGPRYYISNEALTTGAFVAVATAAEAGPCALAAAFTAVSGMMGGPVGTAISGGIALLGIGFFVDLAAKIIGALVQGKGVALYPQWAFPPLKSAIE
ncbi:hypothetical protein H0194_06295 [Corynebacterium incognita]|uniref:Uncharacterized protein n=1 Tax=Corynebacterium incognita TaxID=2754725 RepID=A0A7G7CM97_9CORY|nr:hypothetical protein [Corynebacterium incognita]QNE88713.1 hypothetical protein H0194_06295 [Corynebacterium incognita]